MDHTKKEEEENPKFSAFPFKPYSIQIDFMNALYQSLNQGGISMLESPTGTISLFFQFNFSLFIYLFNFCFNSEKLKSRF